MGAAATRDANGRPPGRARAPTSAPDRGRARTGTATQPCSPPGRIRPRALPRAAGGRTTRSEPRLGRGRRWPRGSPPGLPPERTFHRAADVAGVPEVRAQVLPAAVGEDADDDGALVQLLGELARDVHDRAAGDAGEDPFAVEEGAHGCDRFLVRHEHLPVELR